MADEQAAPIRVLVVDDDHVFLRLMDGVLSKLPCAPVFCENGQQAIDLLRKQPFDICFMDIMMPVMGGIEAAQIIREDLALTLPIIAITSSTMKATHEKCVDVGMNDYIVKPVSFEAIHDVICRYAVK